MRSWEFIKEAAVRPYDVTDIDDVNITNYLVEKCSHCIPMFLDSSFIYRGMNGHASQIIAPASGERKSENTSNHFTSLFDNSPYLGNFPKRSKSLICSMDYSYASVHGNNTYCIFPENGAKIGVCAGRDIWWSNIIIPEINVEFIDRLHNVEQFNYFVSRVFGRGDSFSEMKEFAASHTSVKIDDGNIADYCAGAADVRINTHNPIVIDYAKIINQLQKAISPEKLVMRLSTVDTINTGKREVWTDSKCLCVPRSDTQRIADELMRRHLL